MNIEEDLIQASQEENPERQLGSQDDRDLMHQYANIRRLEMREDPNCDQGHMQLHSQVELICKEWESYPVASKLRFQNWLKDQKAQDVDRQLRDNQQFNKDIRRMAKEKQQRDYHKKRGMPMSIKAFKDFRASIGVCEVTLKPQEIPTQLQDSQMGVASAREQVANLCERQIIEKLKKKVGVESWQVTGGRSDYRYFADREKRHDQMSVAQICKEVDRTELLQQYEKHQKTLVQKKKRTAQDRFALHLVNSLVRDKKFEFDEVLQSVEKAWDELDVVQQCQFDQLDDFDLKFSLDKAERALAKRKPDGPVRLQIKFQYKDTGMQLDGYCFFAQKMRQLLMQENKKTRLKSLEQNGQAGRRLTVGQILTQVKLMWDKLSDHDKADYERKAAEIRETMKAQRYAEQSFSDKQYA